jgi:hypothetical protein
LERLNILRSQETREIDYHKNIKQEIIETMEQLSHKCKFSIIN